MTHEITTQPQWSEEQVTLITNTVAKGATPDELKLFLYTAQRTGLDPLTKQIYFVKRNGQMTIQTGIDGYRVIAERSGALAGIQDAQYDTEKEPHPNKATVTVYKMINGEKVPFTASARWSEYAVEGGFAWKKMPYLMLAKCAEALALRKAFPNDLSGLYTTEEMQQADKPNNVIDPRKLEIKKLCDEKEPLLSTKKQYEEFVKKETGLELEEENYEEIIEKLKKPVVTVEQVAKAFDGEVIATSPKEMMKQGIARAKQEAV